MAKKLFSLEALEARHGDSLVLHYGNPAKPSFILIDGGPGGVYKKSVRPRLMQIKSRWHAGEPLPLQMVMVSHIDDDHINGVLQLTDELIKADGNGGGGGGAPFDILCLWHNSFDDLIGNDRKDLFSRQTASVAAAATTAAGATVAGAHLDRHVAAIIASVPQGRKLRDSATKLGLTLNDPYQGLVVAPPKGGKRFDWGDGLTLTVLGPNEQRVEELHEEWEKQIKASGDAIVAAAKLDDSPFNLASIVVLAELGGRRMLLTGDARGDDLEKMIASTKLPKNGVLHVDLLKLPHHGSDRNVSTDFFRQVRADHYVVSANGDFDNPDVSTLEMLIEARPKMDYAVYLTNRDGKKDLGKKLTKLQKRHPKLDLRFPKKPASPSAPVSITVDLHEKVTY